MKNDIVQNVLNWWGSAGFDLNWLTEAQKDKLLNDLIEDKNRANRPDNFEELKWNPDKVIADLKKNHMKVDENVEMCWYKGKIVHIELPSVWWFEWYRFDYFISDEVVEVDTYNNIKWTIKYHTKRSFWKFLNNLNRYMQQFWIELDKWEVHNWGFEGKINENYRYTGDSSCMIGDYVLGLLNFGRGLLTGYTLLWADALFTVGAGLSNSDEFCFDSIKRVKRWHIMAIVNDEESILEPSETTDSLIEKEVRKAQEAFYYRVDDL